MQTANVIGRGRAFPAVVGRGSSAHPPPSAISRLLADLACVAEADPFARRVNLRPGDVLGRFELLREIGRGGFGVVFEARDLELGRRVAVKTVRPGAPPSAAREGLQREIDAAGLKHPNIVAVLAAGRCERGPWVVFEYLSGETLAQRLTRGPLPVTDVIRVAVAVARALAHAHGRGVLHRDLKPGNVFLTSSGDAKIIDFGLASSPGSRGPRGSGTMGYMSPEQRRGAPEDARTDLFALGLLVHEMATGWKPRSPDGSSRPGTPWTWVIPGVPPALKRLVAALVESDPARRPSSADEVLERLGEIEKGGLS